MTTNHPEHVDEALVRPGRIDKVVELSYMTVSDAADMIEHYFEVRLEEEERSELQHVIEESGNTMTPAMMERYILEVHTVQEVITAIKKRKRRCTEKAEKSTLDLDQK